MPQPADNLFYYFRGPSKGERDEQTQLENNTTKALINTLRWTSRSEVLSEFLKRLSVRLVKPGAVHLRQQKASIAQDVLDKAAERLLLTISLSPAPTAETTGAGPSVPDAWVWSEDFVILIEVKTQQALDEEQLERHRNTLRPTRQKHVHWHEVYQWFHEMKPSSQRDIFLVGQFLEYLELMQLAPFSGFESNDFDAFADVEEDREGTERLRTKHKLKLLLEAVQQSQALPEHIRTELKLPPHMGNLDRQSEHVWGALAGNRDIVQTVQFSMVVDGLGFESRLFLEGDEPARRLRSNIRVKQAQFRKILEDLAETEENFELRITRRVMDRPRMWYGLRDFSLPIDQQIGVTEGDIEYVISKMKQFDHLQFSLVKRYSRHDARIRQSGFVEEVAADIVKLWNLYEFAKG